MPNTLQGKKVAIFAADGVEKVELEQPRAALLDAGADVLLVSPEVTASLEDLAASGRIRWAARGYGSRSAMLRRCSFATLRSTEHCRC